MKPSLLSRKNSLRVVAAMAVLLFLAVAVLLWANYTCQRMASGRMFRSVDSIPPNDVALVLGTARTTARGNLNLHFQQRIDAPAKLYHSGKVRHLLVSGIVRNHMRRRNL